MKRKTPCYWQRAFVLMGLIVGMATTSAPDVYEESRAVYWFFSLNDAAEIQFHGSALEQPVVAGQFVQVLPSDSGGTLYLMVEASTGWFLDGLEPDDAIVSSSVSASQSAVGAAGAAATEETKRGTADLMRIWALDDDFNDVASWTFESVKLVGRSEGNVYVVEVIYPAVDVGSSN